MTTEREPPLPLTVEWSGTPDPRPQRLILGNGSIAIEAVIDRWPGHDHDYYKLRAADGAIYIVRRDAQGQWELVFYDRPADQTNRSPPDT